MDHVTLSTLALDYLAEGVLLVDSNGRIVYANHQAVAMLGHAADKLVGTAFSAPIRTTAPVEISIPRADTDPLVAEMQVVPLQAEDDTLSLVSLRDVTARLESEARLREREELYRSVIESSHDGFWITDGSARILEVNDAYLRMTGYRRADLIGRYPFDVDVDVDGDRVSVAARIERLMKTGEELFETRHRARDGSILDVELSISYTPIDDGRFFVFIRDITPRKQAEASILAAKDAAVQANRAKSEFLAAMSHDLRTPLNAILGFSDMIRTQVFGPLGNDRYGEYIQNIHASGELLVSLVNDLLDLSKVEAGKYEIHLEPLDLGQVMELARQQTATMAASSGQTVVVDRAPDLPTLRSDERALVQVFDNLLTNAIKFNRPDSVIRFRAAADSRGGVRVEVVDQGIGMTASAVAKALRPFEQIDSAHARKHLGTGLGLYLSNELMRLLGGELSIDSAPDVGTTVTLWFPADRMVTA